MHRISKLRKRFSGWRSGVMLCAITTGVVFILNAIFTICALVKHETDRGVSDIYVGSCSKVPRMDAWLHFAINAASTVLLSASNCTPRLPQLPQCCSCSLTSCFKIPCKSSAVRLERKLTRLTRGMTGLTLEFLASEMCAEFRGYG